MKKFYLLVVMLLVAATSFAQTIEVGSTKQFAESTISLDVDATEPKALEDSVKAPEPAPTPSSKEEDYWCSARNGEFMINLFFQMPKDMPDNASYFSMSYEILLGGFISNYFSINAGIGTRFVDMKTELDDYEMDISQAILQIPVDFAVTLPFSNQNSYGLRISAGPRFNFNVLDSRTENWNNHSTSVDIDDLKKDENYKIFSCQLDLSARVILKWLSVSATYSIPMAKNAAVDSGVFSLGCGIYF